MYVVSKFDKGQKVLQNVSEPNNFESQRLRIAFLN